MQHESTSEFIESQTWFLSYAITQPIKYNISRPISVFPRFGSILCLKSAYVFTNHYVLLLLHISCFGNNRLLNLQKMKLFGHYISAKIILPKSWGRHLVPKGQDKSLTGMSYRTLISLSYNHTFHRCYTQNIKQS